MKTPKPAKRPPQQEPDKSSEAAVMRSVKLSPAEIEALKAKAAEQRDYMLKAFRRQPTNQTPPKK